MVGLVIALSGIALHQLTGNAMWDAIGSILVGVLLAVVAVILIDRNRRFLTGEPASSKIYAVAEQRLADMRDVEKVRFLRLEFIGPKQLFLVGSVDLVGDDTESTCRPATTQPRARTGDKPADRRRSADGVRSGLRGPLTRYRCGAWLILVSCAPTVWQ